MKSKVLALMMCLTLSGNLVLATPSFSEVGIFVNHSTAQRLVVDLNYLNQNNKYLTNENTILESQKTELDSSLNISNKQILLLNENITIVKSQKEDYKKYLEGCTKELEDSPSRLNWFALGSVSSLILVAILGFVFVGKK